MMSLSHFTRSSTEIIKALALPSNPLLPRALVFRPPLLSNPFVISFLPDSLSLIYY